MFDKIDNKREQQQRTSVEVLMGKGVCMAAAVQPYPPWKAVRRGGAGQRTGSHTQQQHLQQHRGRHLHSVWWQPYCQVRDLVMLEKIVTMTKSYSGGLNSPVTCVFGLLSCKMQCCWLGHPLRLRQRGFFPWR